jgi:hypothetical protein
MNNKITDVLQKSTLLKNGDEITYYPYTKTRKLVSIQKNNYKFPRNNNLGLKYCSVYFFKGSNFDPERIVLKGDHQDSFNNIINWLKIPLDNYIETNNKFIFENLYENYFIYEDEYNFISGGINKKTGISEVVLTKKNSISFNYIFLEHLNYLATELNETYLKYDFNSFGFNKSKKNDSIKYDLKTIFCKRLHIETISEILNEQFTISSTILSAMSFLYSSNDNDISTLKLNEKKEQFLYEGKIKYNWINLLRKQTIPDMMFYYGTGLFNVNNKLELCFNLYNKIAHE